MTMRRIVKSGESMEEQQYTTLEKNKCIEEFLRSKVDRIQKVKKVALSSNFLNEKFVF